MGQNSELLENTCRLCDENCSLMHSVFERVPEGQQVIQLIQDCLRILIYRTDPLPKQICDSCYHNLLNFSSFKKVSFENLYRQKEKLLECNLENNKSIQLYLNALEQDTFDDNTVVNCDDEDKESGKSSTKKPLKNALIPEAISDSVTIIKIQSNHCGENKLVNGHIVIDDDDDDDDDNSQCSNHGEDRVDDSPFLLSQNAESQSDVDVGDFAIKHLPKISTTNISGKRRRGIDHIEGPVVKKRRFVGPKSRVNERKTRYLKILHKQKFGQKTLTRYSPLSLMQCTLNVINKIFVPDYVPEGCKSIELDSVNEDKLNSLYDNDESVRVILDNENFCNYCDAVLPSETELAIHEKNHMFVVLGEKIDLASTWKQTNECAKISNKWWEETPQEKKLNGVDVLKEKAIANFDDSTGRVNVIDPDDVDFKDTKEGILKPRTSIKKEGVCMDGEVVLIDTQATVNGVLLSDLPKDERRTIYQNVTVNSVKRKFCPLCRYTFKDNWAIESHYFSTACHFTCRFCGVRFNKQRNEFDSHIKAHIECGDVHTNKIFASRKFHSTPKVILASNVKERPAYIPRQAAVPKIKPIKMKHLLEKQNHTIEIKKEIDPDEPVYNHSFQNDSKQNQAYFCRKCYQMFYKLDEFNIHIINCTGGTSFSSTSFRKISPSFAKGLSSPTRQPEPEKFSPTGRPMRNCVREIGTYADDMNEDNGEYSRFRRIGLGKSARGFECEMCSSCFPTVHSRNSHMRIHKSGIHELSTNSVTITQNRTRNVAKGVANIISRYSNIQVKQEPMEPLVEIHEQSSKNYSSVSITPISGGSNRNSLDPKIMKLVQNNPNITIKTRPNSFEHNNMGAVGSNNADDGRSYRCLSCSQPFANKSNLYFHKKNHCSGSKYPCPFCKKRFGSESAYSSHIFYNHPE